MIRIYTLVAYLLYISIYLAKFYYIFMIYWDHNYKQNYTCISLSTCKKRLKQYELSKCCTIASLNRKWLHVCKASPLTYFPISDKCLFLKNVLNCSEAPTVFFVSYLISIYPWFSLDFILGVNSLVDWKKVSTRKIIKPERKIFSLIYEHVKFSEILILLISQNFPSALKAFKFPNEEEYYVNKIYHAVTVSWWYCTSTQGFLSKTIL